METGLFIKWGKLVPGREREAIELFEETRRWFDEQYKKDLITYWEPFFFASGDLEAARGFFVVKGERDKILKITQDDTYLWITAKVQFVAEHVEVEWLRVGDEIPQQLERTHKLAAEFAPVH